MATREFEASYLKLQIEAAQVGLVNHIENEWVKDCRRVYNYMEKQNKSFWARFKHWVIYDSGLSKTKLLPFDEFVEDRRTWLYSQYSQTYTWYQDHVEGWLKQTLLFDKLGNLAKKNAYAGNTVKIDENEWSTICKYKEILRS